MFKSFLILIALLIACQLAYSQMRLNGRIESEFIDAQDGAPLTSSGNVINSGYPTFQWRLRGYLDMKVSEQSYIFGDLRLEQDGLRVDYAAIRVYLNREQSAGFQTGMLGTFIGNVMARRSAKYNPVIQLPIMYEYRTATHDEAGSSGYSILNDRGLGQGLRILNRTVYSPGFEFFISFLNWLDLNAGFYNTAPSASYYSNYSKRLNMAGRLGIRPIMGANIGFSASHGPYLVPYGANDMNSNQTLYDVDLAYERGHFSFFAEGLYNRWSYPGFDDPLGVFSYYVEGKYKLLPRLFLASRFGQLLFQEVTMTSGAKTKWDDDVSRIEFGIGYYIQRETLAKIVLQTNQTSRVDPRDDYIAVQLSAGY
ncbi:hypothetical protein A2V82_13870 [candidate division KSB1 bacterium RBG_16_48_16]|nr:MAG: hypothetical protein A2V82_13870 [candidate division KSB1 bacterium RBG_16_48_16]